MKKVAVPKSVKKKVFREILIRFVKLVIFLAIAYVISDWLWVENTDNLNFKSAGPTTVTVVLYVLPFVFSGIPVKLIDKNWYGKIISIETETVKSREKISETVDRNHYLKQIALIETPDGKLHEKRIYDEGTLLHENAGEVYSVGDTVVHAYGTDYLVPLRNKNDTKKRVVCAYCGFKSPNGTDVCQNCGCSTEIYLVDSAKK